MKHIVLSLSAVAMLAGCSVGRATPTDTVHEFVQKLSSGQCAGLKDYLAESTPEQRQTMGIAGPTEIERSCTREFEARAKAGNPGQQGLKQATIMDQQEQGDRATIRFQLEMQSGEKLDPATFVLTRKDGRWRIDEYETILAMRSADLQNRMPPPPTMGPPAGTDAPGAQSLPAPADNAPPKAE